MLILQINCVGRIFPERLKCGILYVNTDLLVNVIGFFYAPNFEEVEGAYWFGPVRLSVRPSVRYALCWL